VDKEKKVTIREVAKESGCSIATVSRVINGTNKSYSPETQKKVEEAVKKLNYQPNLNAKGLKESRSFHIAYLVPQMDDYYVSIMDAVQESAERKGYSVLVLNSNYSEKHIIFREERIMSKLEPKVKPRIGLLPTGHKIYWSQFPTLKEKGMKMYGKLLNLTQFGTEQTFKLIYSVGEIIPGDILHIGNPQLPCACAEVHTGVFQ